MPQKAVIPVQNGKFEDWNAKSFWFGNWGTSVVHKGIDIFNKKSTPILSTVDGIVLFNGQRKKGGNVVMILGPKWLIHYYSHLDTIETKLFSFVKSGEKIGTMGDSGNAKGKPFHLHYSIIRVFPNIFDIDTSIQGYKKAFFVDPNTFLKEALNYQKKNTK
ncbi:MAG: M23 family metallopeptidase [Candidatus Marinarcus sp.]|uniref:M23 family metallopeptidase n=1 Tax=Candidatus Marinarcus sp. TaxID=3100987 RepID=UPI003AFFBFD7